VYIAEAHAVDEWQMESNAQEGICITQHTTFDERLAAARLCERRLNLTIPTFVDAMDNAVSRQFAAWPERIYIIGADGRVAFQGGPGPYEFRSNAAAQALEALLA
jgi:hypothetical protein